MAEFLDGTVDAPGVGRIKKVYIYVPAGLAGAYVAWKWWQASRASSEAPAGSDGLYSSSDLSDYGLSTTGGGTNITGNTGNTTTDGTDPNAINTNADWTNKAVERLTNQGYDGAVVVAALGEFLGRRALDKTEASIARAALAVAGQPPVGGPYSVIEEATQDSGTLAAPKNLRPWDTTTTTQIGFQWDPVPGALYYEVYRSDLRESVGADIDGKFWAQGLKPNTSYTFRVVPVSTTNKRGTASANYTAKTAAVKLTAPTGLRASNITRTSFRVSLTPVSGADQYRWYVNGQQTGFSENPYRDFTGLRPNTAYRIQAAADTQRQVQGPTSDALPVRTKK